MTPTPPSPLTIQDNGSNQSPAREDSELTTIARLIRLAKEFFQVLVVTVNVQDEPEVWRTLLPDQSIPDSPERFAFCHLTISGKEPLIISNALNHDRFRTNPLVTGSTHLRFYAGIALKSTTGQMMGSFCLMDNHPRHLGANKVTQLKDFAAIIENELNFAEAKRLQRELARTNHILEGMMIEARAAEQARRTVEETLRSTLNSMDDLVFVLDKDGLFIEYYQPDKAPELYIPPEAFVGYHFCKVLPPHMSTPLKQAFVDLQEGQPVTQFDYKIEENGQIGWYNAKISRRVDATGLFAGVTIVARDVTEKKQIELALQERKARLSEAQRLANLGTWSWDLSQDMLIFDKHSYRICGISPGTPIHFEMIKAQMYAQDQAQTQKIVDQALASDAPGFTVEHPMLLPDGQLRYIIILANIFRDPHGKPTHMEGVIQDITDQKQAQQALDEERNLLRIVIDNLPDYIYIKDRQSRFLLGNRAVAKVMCDGDPETLIGKQDADFYPEGYSTKFLQDEQAVIRSGKPLLNSEERIIDHKGNESWVLTSKVPLRDQTGEIIGLVGIGREITQLKLHEQDLRQARRKARQLAEQAKDRARRMALLNEMSRQINLAASEAEIYKVVNDHISNICSR